MDRVFLGQKKSKMSQDHEILALGLILANLKHEDIFFQASGKSLALGVQDVCGGERERLGFALLRYEIPLALIGNQIVDIGLCFDANHMGPS